MNRFELLTYRERGYAPRTRHNAQVADLTAAFAYDFESRGEQLTRRCAADRYVSLPLGGSPIESARQLYRALRARHATVLNIAGNSIATLARHGMPQSRANAYVFETLQAVTRHWPLRCVVSGGQSGIDFAGGVAAIALGIDAVLMFPPGFLQRDIHGTDRAHTEAELRMELMRMAAQLAPGRVEGQVSTGVQPGVQQLHEGWSWYDSLAPYEAYDAYGDSGIETSSPVAHY
jgi:hypothetical protein